MSKISPAMRQKLAVEAQERCGYCQSQQISPPIAINFSTIGAK